MSEDDGRQGQAAGGRGDDRKARLAAALRANLKRRKEQARARHDTAEDPSGPKRPAEPPRG